MFQSRLFLLALAMALIAIQQDATAQQGNNNTAANNRLIYERCMMEDTIVNSDLWADEPKIMSAGFGFSEIVGCADTINQQTVLQCQGAWQTDVVCTVCKDGKSPNRNGKCAPGNEPPNPPPTRVLTSAGAANALDVVWGSTFSRQGGLPICFSWPVIMSTAATGVDFEFTKATVQSDGTIAYSKIYAKGRTSYPNFEKNEKHCVVVAGDWGARLPSTIPGASWPVNLTIINDTTPLMLVGPNGPVSAVGLSINSSTSNPYDAGKGPYLLAAKVSKMNVEGEGGNAFQEQICDTCMPNDGVSLYGKTRARYRLRMYYSGGFTPNGVRALKPTQYSRFFRVYARHRNGNLVALPRANVVYRIPEPISIIGMADLGRKQEEYDNCYDEDRDNYIDIILTGSRKAMARLHSIKMPTKRYKGMDYKPLFNPGGPGSTPFPNITYTQPSPPNSIRIQNALVDPKVVSYASSRQCPPLG